MEHVQWRAMDRTLSLLTNALVARSLLLLLAMHMPGAGAQLPGPAAGRGGAVDIQTVVGFTDSFVPGRWTPVTVTVANRGRDLAGYLEVVSIHGDALADQLFTFTQRRELHLTRDSRKRFQFTVRLENPSRALLVRVTASGKELARHSVDLRRRFSSGSVVLVLSRDADLDYLNDSATGGLRVMYPHPELLPERWQGYDAVKAVVLHGMSLRNLSERQYEALRRWLAGGGTLAVSGGANYSLLRTPRLASLLPAVPSGLMEVASPQAAGHALGLSIPPSQGFHVNRLSQVSGLVRIHTAGTPLVVERRDGRGKVVFLSFDLARAPFDRLPGMKALLPQLLRLPPPQPLPAYRDRINDEDAIEALLDGRATPFPGHATVLYFVAFYLALLATGFRLRARGRWGRWLLPWMTWAAPLIFAPAAYWLFGPVLFPKGISVVAISVIEPFPESSYASSRLQLGLYANRAQPLVLDYEGAAPVFQARLQPRMHAPGWTFTDRGGGNGAYHLQVDERRSYVLHGLEGHDIIPFKLAASVILDSAGPTLVLRNDSGRALSNVWLLVDGQGYAVGTVDEEAEISKRFDSETQAVALWRDAPWRVLERDGDARSKDFKATRIVIERALVPTEDGQYLRPGQALLLGYATTPLRPLGAGWRMEELAVVMMHIPVRRLPGPGEHRRDLAEPL